MRVKAVKLKVDTSDLASLDLSGFVDFIAPKVENAFRNDIGPLYVDHAKKLAPVSKRAPSKNSRKGSARPVKLIKAVPAGRNIGASVKRLKDLREGNVEVDVTSDAEFFVGTGAQDDPAKFKESTKDRTPDKLAFRGGAVVGVFQHKPGTLRDSIHIQSITRRGNQVVMRVVASAPYAFFVHDGFMNRGKTRMAPRPFLRKAFGPIRTKLQNPKTYR